MSCLEYRDTLRSRVPGTFTPDHCETAGYTAYCYGDFRSGGSSAK